MAKNFWKCFNYNNFNRIHCNMCDKYSKNKFKKKMKGMKMMLKI